jgi:membrane peptidoglycan carboxypeptidase
MAAVDEPPAEGSPRRGRTLAKLLGAILLAGCLLAAMLVPVVGGIGVAAKSVATEFLDVSCDVAPAPTQQTTTILAADRRTVIASLFDQNRHDVPLSAVPQIIRQALLATEDRRFYDHHGVDLRGMVRAAVHNATDGGAEGGSTLTMQLVKQERAYRARTPAEQQAAVSQDLHRKLKDAKCAVELEKRYSKAQILNEYLNVAFFGENSYGIETAARTYFDKSATQLTVPEGALLIGLVRSPTAYDPFLHPQAARERRNEVLANMVATHDLTRAQAVAYATQPVRLASSAPPPVRQGCASTPPDVVNVGFFCDYVVSWLESHGVSAAALRTGGLRIVTTLDAAAQTRGQRQIWRAGLKPTSATALVMPAVDPRTGAVRTMISSRRYGVNAKEGESVLPLFTAGYAGAGSTYKYFTTLAALSLGAQPTFTLNSGSDSYTVRNCPVDEQTHRRYEVHNAGNYAATLPLKDALPQSVNTYFVALEDQFFGCNLKPVVQTALDLGMTTLNRQQNADSRLSIAQAVVQQHQPGFTLGFSPTSALELTSAYGTVANDGVYCPPNPIAEVTGPGGGAVPYDKPKCRRVVDRQVARTMVKMMTADTQDSEGTAASYFQNWYASGGSPVAAKTGTDNDAEDGPRHGKGNSALWFVGVTPRLTSAAALVNPVSPKATVTGLPASVTNNGSDVFGAYASTFWLKAYGPMLRAHPWRWPDPSGIAGATNVPDVTGRSPSDAARELRAAGFSMVLASIRCGSFQPTGQVGYFAPHLAARGSKVTVCLSNGIAPNGYDGGYQTYPQYPSYPDYPTYPDPTYPAAQPTQAPPASSSAPQPPPPPPPPPPPSPSPTKPGHSHGP